MTFSFIMLSLAAIYMLHNRLRMDLQVFLNETFLDQSVDDLHAGMAAALRLLETGVPASPPLTCRLDLPDRPGPPPLAVGYAVAAGSWTVTVSTQDVSSLSACPETF